MSNGVITPLIGLAATVAILRTTERIARESLKKIPRQPRVRVKVSTKDPFTREAFAIHNNFKRRF